MKFASVWKKLFFSRYLSRKNWESGKNAGRVKSDFKAQKSRIKQQIDDLIFLKVNVCS